MDKLILNQLKKMAKESKDSHEFLNNVANSKFGALEVINFLDYIKLTLEEFYDVYGNLNEKDLTESDF